MEAKLPDLRGKCNLFEFQPDQVLQTVSEALNQMGKIDFLINGKL